MVPSVASLPRKRAPFRQVHSRSYPRLSSGNACCRQKKLPLFPSDSFIFSIKFLYFFGEKLLIKLPYLIDKVDSYAYAFYSSELINDFVDDIDDKEEKLKFILLKIATKMSSDFERLIIEVQISNFFDVSSLSL